MTANRIQSNPIQSNPMRSEPNPIRLLPTPNWIRFWLHLRTLHVPNAKWLTSFLLQSSGLLGGWGQQQWLSTLLFMMLFLDKRNQQLPDAVCLYPHAAQSGSIGGPKMTILRVLILLSVLVSHPLKTQKSGLSINVFII